MSKYILYERGGVWQARVCEFTSLSQASSYVMERSDIQWGLWDEDRNRWVLPVEMLMAANNLTLDDVLKKRVNWRQEGF